MTAAFALSATFAVRSPQALKLSARCAPLPAHRIAATRRLLHRPTHTHLHTTAPTMSVQEGSSAPDFTKTDGDGKEVMLSSFKGARNVVLYFSNGAGSGCTAQSCSFRDAAEDFAKLDAEIIAVSAQRDTTAFKRDNSLPFSVIPDPKGELQKLYGVPATLGLIPGRVTFVIDKEGIVRSVYNSQFSTAAHVKTAEETLKALS